MEVLHVMLPEDEIFLCGMALLYGVIVGIIGGLYRAWRARRAA
jgi:hypothetical protein